MALAPRLLAYALARTGCRATAEDVAQESLMALVRHWRERGRPESPDAFVFAVAKRRSGRAVARRALMAPLEAVRHFTATSPSPSRIYERRADAAALRAALRSLNAKDREALILRAAGELSIRDIAVLMKSSPGAIKMRLSRARRRVSELMQEDADGKRTRTA